MTITADNAGGFFKDALTAKTDTTGNLTFNKDKNSVKADEYGAFFAYKPGDTLVMEGTNNGLDGVYTVKSVSEDGKTIVFEDGELSNKMANQQKRLTLALPEPPQLSSVLLSLSVLWLICPALMIKTCRQRFRLPVSAQTAKP